MKGGLLWQLFNYNWRQNLFRTLGLRRTHDLEAPLYKGWTFDLNQIRDDNWGMVVNSLMYQSLNKIELIPFEEFVELAGGQISHTLRNFLEEYEFLFSQICSFYVERPNSVKPGGHLCLMNDVCFCLFLRC